MVDLPTRAYPAKVLLFGEHTVLRGGRGLAVPYRRLALRWTLGAADDRLVEWADSLDVRFWEGSLDVAAFRRAARAGCRLEGDVPLGYGLGSSGAVCAAVFDAFGRLNGETLTPERLHRLLTRLEGYFHGQSSGTDPYVSYLDQPVLLSNQGIPEVALLPANWQREFFLYDTGQGRSATPYIEQFIRRYDGGEATAIAGDWTAAADAAISAVVAGERATIHRHFRRISDFQAAHFPSFIPAAVRPVWQTAAYCLKLCGAGGGGMLLGLATDRAATEAALGKVAWLEND